MVKEVTYDPILLGIKSEKATIEDLQVAEDLLDTLTANAAGCVGMAANMIGVHNRIICFDDNGKYMTMFNPGIIKKSDPIRLKRGVFHSLVVLINVSGIRVKKCSGRLPNSRPESKLLPAGQPKLSNTKLTIVMES